jgi:hypothetical protein
MYDFFERQLTKDIGKKNYWSPSIQSLRPMRFGTKFHFFFFVTSLDDGRQKIRQHFSQFQNRRFGKQIRKHNVHFLGTQQVGWNKHGMILRTTQNSSMEKVLGTSFLTGGSLPA